MKASRLAAMVVFVGLGALSGCTRSSGQGETSSAASTSPTAAARPADNAEKTDSPPAPLVDPGAKAQIGKPAPLFTLPDETGKPVSLADHKGKVTVIEWFNPDCPFVRASHEKGSLVNAAKNAKGKDVVWLAVNSGAPGKQGHGAKRNAEARKQWSLPHPVLIDETGAVGKAYGAKRTPHIFVIDDKGVLVYAGAVDNSPDGEGESPKDGKLVSYVDTTLDALEGNRPVEPATTEAYGCSVKYAD